MKKTFKGYSALIALLIALLVVTSMPLMAFANETTAEAEIPVMQVKVGNETHEVDPDDMIEGKAATCSSTGYNYYACKSGCKKADGTPQYHMVTTEKVDHKWVRTLTAGASCTEGGAIIEKCSVCGTVNGTYTVAATGHSFNYDTNAFNFFKLTDYYPDFSVTPDKATSILLADEWPVAAKEEDQAKTDADEIARYEEEYGFVIDKLPTCSTDGKGHFVCSVCGETSKSYIIDQEGFDWNHDWVNWKTMTAATCTKGGKEMRYCKLHQNQDMVEFRDTEALGHKYAVTKINWNGCYLDTVDVNCTVCKKAEAKNLTLDAIKAEPYNIAGFKQQKAHVFEEKVQYFDAVKSEHCALSADGKTIVPDSCDVDYKIAYKCKNWDAAHTGDADAYHYVEVKAAGHKWGEWVEVSAPSGDDDAGLYVRECSVCGHHENVYGTFKDGEVKAYNFEIDLSGVEDGEGIAVITTDNEISAWIKEADLYARIAWFYETDDGLTYGFTAIKSVEYDEDGNLIADISGPNPGEGFNFTGVQVVLTTDKNAHKTAEYADNALAMAKA